MALQCSTCGSADWIAAYPGDAQADRTTKVVALHPDQDIPMVVWCAPCWPWSPAEVGEVAR